MNHWLFGKIETKEECHETYELTVTNMKGDIKMQMTGKNKICGLTSARQRIKEKGQNRTDNGYKSLKIGLLFGADYAEKIETDSMIHLDKYFYVLQTKLGWKLQSIEAMNHDTGIATVGLTMGIEKHKERILSKRSDEEPM